MALANDYFGLDVLGYDPYHQQKLDTLARYQTIDQLVGQQAQGTAPTGTQTRTAAPAPTPTQTYTPPQSGISGFGDLATYNMTAGTGGNYQPQAIMDRPGGTGDTGGAPRGDTGGTACPEGYVREADGSCHQLPPPGNSTGTEGQPGGQNDPCPAGQVRNNLGYCTWGQAPGSPGGGCPRGMHEENGVCVTDNPDAPPRDSPTGTAINNIYTSGNIPPDIQALRTALGQFLTQNFNATTPGYGGNLMMGGSPYMGQAAAAGAQGAATSNQYGGLFESLLTQMQGAYPGLQQQLGAIDTQGKGQLEDVGAQIREQYGAMGLGAGSDVAEAVARGQGRTIADMNVQKGNLLQGAWEGQQNRLLGGAGVIPGMTQAMSSGYGQYGNLLAQLAGMDLGIQEGNITRPYQEFIRQQENPYMNYALGMATGFPPNPNPKPVVQSSGNSLFQTLGLLAGTLGAAAITKSDRDGKEDIRPFHGSVLETLRKLDINTWRYAGEDTVHLGPMAQDMQRLFGVGDGKSVHLVDVIGILLAAAKEMADAKNS
jgi:hypothetical protein